MRRLLGMVFELGILCEYSCVTGRGSENGVHASDVCEGLFPDILIS